MSLELPDDVTKRLRRGLAEYVESRFEHDVGELQAQRLLEFVLGFVGAAIYNQAIADAQAYMQAKLIDLEIDLHEPVRDRVDEEPGGRGRGSSPPPP